MANISGEMSRLTASKLINFAWHKTKERNSKCVANVSYNPYNNELTIEFIERGTYKYSDVPVDVYMDFEDAGSQGTYFNLYIRDNYQYERVA